MRQPGERRDRVHGRVEDQLRPLRGPQVVERLRLQARGRDQVGDGVRVGGRRAAVRADPGRRVEDVLDVRVAVARAAHERDRREERPRALRADDLLGAEPVLHGHHRRAGEVPGEAPCQRVEVAALAREDDEVGVELRRIGRRRHARGEVGAARDADALARSARARAPRAA